jgi:hypothetical protein
LPLCRRSNDDWAQYFNDYPGRFKIEYASPDDVNGLCFRNNLVQYDSSVTHRPSRYAVRMHVLLVVEIDRYIDCHVQFQTDKEPIIETTGIPSRLEPVT